MQTNDPRHFSSLSPSRKNDQENGRNAEGRSLSQAGKRGEQSVHCSRTGSLNASTYHKNRKSQQKEKRSFLGVCGRQKFTANLSKVMGDNKPTAHKSFQPPLQPACSCLCCKTPEKSGTGLSGEQASRSESSQPGTNFTTISEHHSQDRSSPPGAGAAWGEGVAG